jgi:hypothetical protein
VSPFDLKIERVQNQRYSPTKFISEAQTQGELANCMTPIKGNRPHTRRYSALLANFPPDELLFCGLVMRPIARLGNRMPGFAGDFDPRFHCYSQFCNRFFGRLTESGTRFQVWRFGDPQAVFV